MKSLHKEWFPIRYEDEFYNKIAVGRRWLSLGAFYKDLLIGVILIRYEVDKPMIKDISSQSIFSCSTSEAAYIMAIGVIDEFW